MTDEVIEPIAETVPVETAANDVKKDAENDWNNLLEHIVAKCEGDIQKAWDWVKGLV